MKPQSRSQEKRIEAQKEMNIDDLKCCGNCDKITHECFTDTHPDECCDKWQWDQMKSEDRS